jgi:hypothetical protein
MRWISKLALLFLVGIITMIESPAGWLFKDMSLDWTLKTLISGHSTWSDPNSARSEEAKKGIFPLW